MTRWKIKDGGRCQAFNCHKRGNVPRADGSTLCWGHYIEYLRMKDTLKNEMPAGLTPREKDTWRILYYTPLSFSERLQAVENVMQGKPYKHQQEQLTVGDYGRQEG
jgi:hypothetical protein